MTNEKTCESRTNTWNDWCKIDNSKTHFVKKREFHLLELLGFKDPNIKNKTEMDKYVLQKFYKYNNTGKYELDETRKTNLYNKVISEISKIKDNTFKYGGNTEKIPFFKEEQLYSFLNKNNFGTSIETINLLADLKDLDEDTIKKYKTEKLNLNIYGLNSATNFSKPTSETKQEQIDLLYKLFKFQTDYLYKHKYINNIISQYPNIKTDVNLYYHYYEDAIKNKDGKDNPKEQQFRYLGGLVSQNEILNKYEKLKILKIPQRCLKEISDKEYIDLNTTLDLVIHPIYKTILKRPDDNIVWKLKPCIQLQTTFRQQSEYYNNIKNKCKQYSKVNVENPIFTKTSEQVNTKIKHDIIKRNAYIINEKKKALEELKKEDIIKKNINRAYNRGKLNKYLNKKEENLYMLNKKLNDSKNAIDLNFYYSGDILTNCFDSLKDSSLSKEDKISKCNTIIENNLEKQKKEQEKEILTTCKQTDFIRKDEVPCWGCTDIVMN